MKEKDKIQLYTGISKKGHREYAIVSGVLIEPECKNVVITSDCTFALK